MGLLQLQVPVYRLSLKKINTENKNKQTNKQAKKERKKERETKVTKQNAISDFFYVRCITAIIPT